MARADLTGCWIESPWTNFLCSHQIYHPLVRISSAKPTWFSNSSGVELLISSATKTEPDLSSSRTLSILFQIPSFCQISFPRFQVNRRCLISSHPWWQARQLLEFSICRFARIPRHGKRPCNTLQLTILILLGTESFHRRAHTSSSPTPPLSNFHQI